MTPSKRILARYWKWKKMAEDGLTMQQIADADGANLSTVSYGMRRIADLSSIERKEYAVRIAGLTKRYNRVADELTMAKRRIAMLRQRVKKQEAA